MEALETRAHDITIGSHEGETKHNPWQPNNKDIDLGNLITNLKKGISNLG